MRVPVGTDVLQRGVRGRVVERAALRQLHDGVRVGSGVHGRELRVRDGKHPVQRSVRESADQQRQLWKLRQRVRVGTVVLERRVRDDVYGRVASMHDRGAVLRFGGLVSSVPGDFVVLLRGGPLVHDVLRLLRTDALHGQSVHLPHVDGDLCGERRLLLGAHVSERYVPGNRGVCLERRGVLGYGAVLLGADVRFRHVHDELRRGDDRVHFEFAVLLGDVPIGRTRRDLHVGTDCARTRQAVESFGIPIECSAGTPRNPFTQ